MEGRETAAPLVFPHPLVHDTLLCCPLLSAPPGSPAVGDLSWRESGLPVKGRQRVQAADRRPEHHSVSAFSVCGIFPPQHSGQQP